MTEEQEPEFCIDCSSRGWGYAEPDLVEDCDILFVGTSPTGKDVEDNEPFTKGDEAGHVLREYLRKFDGKKISYSVTMAIKCHTPAGKKPGLKLIRRCKPLLEDDIAYTKPKLIVALGQTALTALTGIGSGIMKLNGHILREKQEHKDAVNTNIPIAVCLHPAFVVNSKEQEKAEKQFEKGMLPALHFFDEQEILPHTIKRNIYPSDEEVGFDIETNELNPLIPGAVIRCFSVSDGERAIFVKVEDK